MQKSQKILLNIIILSFLTFIPKFVFAARFPFFGPIVPCGREGLPECNLCHFFELGQNIIDFMLTLIFLIAPVMIIVGGIYMLTSAGAPGKVTQGKQIITYTIIALLIAFGSWLIVNEFLVILAGEKAVEGSGPWPWPWNEINCGGTTSKEEPTFTGGTYCVCEVPVYDLDPNQYPSQASIIGKNIKVSGPLASGEACQQACVLGNVDVYCPFTLKKNEANLYCADKSYLKSKRACGIKFTTQKTSIDCQISKECFATDADCVAVVTPTLPVFNKEYAQKCFVNGEELCNARILKGGNTYCVNKYPAPCSSKDKKFALYRWKSEISEFETNAYDCSRRAYGNSGIVCRLDCQYDKECRKTDVNRCDELNPPLGQKESCFGGNYTCQQGVIDQFKDACSELKELLTCMAGKLPSAAKEISSISDNSGGRCFKEWTRQCSANEDSCSGICCGHSACSLHYGGKANQEGGVITGPSDICGIGSVDCRKCSWAVDFANESYFQQIKQAAEECGKKLFKNLGKVDVIHEGNHIHVELEGVAKWHKCK